MSKNQNDNAIDALLICKARRATNVFRPAVAIASASTNRSGALRYNHDMSSETYAALIGAIIGGLLSFGAAWFLQIQDQRKRDEKEKKRLDDTRALLRTALKEDLERAPSLFDSLSEKYQITQEVWIITLGEIRTSQAVYWRNQDTFYLLTEKERKKAADYYLRVHQILGILEAAHNLITADKDKIRAYAQHLMLTIGNMDGNTATNHAEADYADEVARMTSNKAIIEQEFQKLTVTRADAESLLKLLSKVE